MRWSLNTTRLSLSSLTLSVAGVTIIGTTLMSLSETCSGDLLFGAGPIALGKVIGQLSGDGEIGLIPEEDDNMLQAIGVGFSEVPIGLVATFYEPGNPSGVYTVQNDTAWILETSLDAAREGAIIKRKLKTQGATSWNGVTAIDLAARGQDPSIGGALFAAAGLALSL